MKNSTGAPTDTKNKQVIILAGATGNLGQHIAAHLVRLDAEVKALVRKGSRSPSLDLLRQQGIAICEVEFSDQEQLVAACSGGSCLVSALNGLRDVIVDVQTNLVKAAIAAGVPRFIPSDYCIDYTKLTAGGNRNLDLRRQFAAIIHGAPIQPTSILNGMFTNLLTGQAPVILPGVQRVVYWENAQQLLDFTTIDNTAEFTARAAMDRSTPRFLRIAGEETSVTGLKDTAAQVYGKPFRLLRAGGLGRLRTLIRITQTIAPQKKEVFPPWQGMQYLHDMFTGKPKLSPLDNHRYAMRWTPVAELLQKAHREKNKN